MSLRKYCPYQKLFKKYMVASNFTQVNPAKKKNVNVTIKSPKGMLNMRSHGTALAF